MPVGFTTVRVNVGAFIIDGLDLDDLFDDEPVTGKLVLEPMLEPGKPVQVDDNGVMKIKAIAPFPVDIGATGDISHRGRDYVTVPAPTSATTNIGQLQWKATFKDLKYGLTPITVPAIYFWAVPGADVNLAEEVNVAPGSTAVQISRGARGYGVVGAVPVEDEPAFAIEYETPTGTALSDPIPLPEGASVPDGGIDADKLAEDAVTRPKLAQAVRDELDEKLTQTEAAASYAPLWQAGEVLTAGTIRVAPTGVTISRTANGTARPNYDATEAALWSRVVAVPADLDSKLTTPAGGTAGQVLSKTVSGTAWNDPPAGGAGTQIVYHEADAGYPRPSTAAAVFWAGSVQPLNLAAGDIWLVTSAVPLAPEVAWLRSYEAEDFALADLAAVATWDDNKGTVDLTQPTAGNRPQYLAASGSQPARVKFTRDSTTVGDWMITSAATLNQPGCVVAVVKLTSVVTSTATADRYRLFCGIGTVNSWTIDQVGEAGGTPRWRIAVGSNLGLHTSAVADTEWTVLVANFNGAETWLRVNGVEQTFTNIGTAPSDGFNLGSNQAHDGSFLSGEVERLQVIGSLPTSILEYEAYLLDLVATWS